MSLRSSSKVGFVKNGLKSLNGGGLKNYCTNPRPVDEPAVVFAPLLRPSNEIFPQKYPFPGSIGLSRELAEGAYKPELDRLNLKSLAQKPNFNDLFRQQLIEFSDRVENQMRIQTAADHVPELPMRVEVFKADRAMELKAMQCPKMIKRDLGNMFADVNINWKEAKVTVLNLTQKSATDMSAWSEEMEVERDLLTKDFINVATAICHDLEKMNYWADFIEPSSGRPYLGGYTNSSLFETDDRYRELGFKIEDLGCCKVIKHIDWSTHAFVGTIFTNAPIDSPEIKAILAKSQDGQYFEEPAAE